MLKQNSLLVVVVLCLFVVGCQTAEPEVVEVPVEAEVVVEIEVTRIMEVPVEVEVTRIVEVPVEAEAAPVEAPNVFPPLVTDVRTYTSEATGRDYTVFVSLPISYGMLDEPYPVIYLTDGDFFTLPTAMTAAILAGYGEMPEVITVGVGYGGSPMESLERRDVDLLQEKGSFLQFLQEELIPDIEANYEADPAVRTLLGTSDGGTFALYAMAHAPKTFSRFIASSPACGAGCAALAKAYGEEHGDLPVRLFASVGDLDEGAIPGYEALEEGLQVGGYENLTSELAVLDGESHVSAQPRSFTTGLRWVFAADE